MATNEGGRAFPNDGKWANGMPEGGMSLRDYFAGQALVGILAGSPDVHVGSDLAAANAYNYADKMLAHRDES